MTMTQHNPPLLLPHYSDTRNTTTGTGTRKPPHSRLLSYHHSNDNVTVNIYINVDEIEQSSSSSSFPTTTARDICNDLSSILLFNNNHDHHTNHEKRIQLTMFGGDCVGNDNNGHHDTTRTGRHGIIYDSVFQLLKKHEHILTIHLRHVTLDSSWFVPLLVGQRKRGNKISSFVSLQLYHCQISSDAHHHDMIQQPQCHDVLIQKAFRMNQTLERLMLLKIDTVLLDHILHSMVDHTHICHIDVEAPEDPEHHTRLIQTISEILHNNKKTKHTIQHLELRGFQFGSTSTTTTHHGGIIEATTYCNFFNAIMSCKTLHHLTLQGGYFDHACTIQFEHSIANSTIQIIDIEWYCVFIHNQNKKKNYVS
jgi:hypothetical protein